MPTAKAWINILETLGIIFLLQPYPNNVLKRTIKTPGGSRICTYRDRDTKETDVIIEGDGKLCPIEIKKTATPDKRLVKTFGLLDKAPLKIGTGAVLCMAERFGAFDRNNLIVPIWII